MENSLFVFNYMIMDVSESYGASRENLFKAHYYLYSI